MKLTDLETAIMTALETLVTAKTLGSAINVSATTITAEEVMNGAGVKLPAAALVYEGGDFRPLNVAAGIYDHRPEFSLKVVVPTERAKTASASGLPAILAAILNAISGQQFELDIKGIEFGKLELVEWRGTAIAYNWPLSTRFAWNVADEAAPEEEEG